MKTIPRAHHFVLGLLVLLAASAAQAQGAHGVGAVPAPAAEPLSLAQKAARRFPQPVRVGDLRDRLVLEPSNHQGVLGRVDGVARTEGGSLELVVRYGGLLGIGTRTIAVPIEATTLLGPFMQIVDIDEAHLRAWPTFDPAGTARLGADETIRVGINRN